MHSLFLCCAQFLKRRSSVCIAITLGLLFFFIQLLFINDYGVTWDEPLHRNWGKLFALFFKTGDRHLLELMPGNGIHYGPLYYFFNYLLSEKLYASHVLLFVAANHLLNLLTASVAVGFVFLLGEEMSSRRVGFLSLFFFVFFPPFLAHAHYNPKDIPLMTSVLIMSFVFVKAMHSDSKKLFLLTGFLLGVSIALKVSALLMVPVFALSYVFHRWHRSERVRMPSELRTVMFILLAVCVGTIVAWPSAWGDLLLIPRAIVFFSQDFWPGTVLFFGTEYTGEMLPWYYTPLEHLMAMPFLAIAVFLCGIITVFSRFLKKHSDPSLLLLSLWVIFPLLFSLKPNLVRYDGMRQFFFCLPAVALFAALGFDRCLSWVLKFRHGVRLALVITVILFTSLVHEVVVLHPFEGSYRNELVRFFIPKDMDRLLQIEYWGPSYLQGMAWLREHAEPNPVICVPTAGVLVTWYPWRDDFTFECSAKSDYVMFFSRYSETKDYADLASDPIFTIERMHSKLLKIYKVK